jgi:hypothetical protein
MSVDLVLLITIYDAFFNKEDSYKDKKNGKIDPLNLNILYFLFENRVIIYDINILSSLVFNSMFHLRESNYLFKELINMMRNVVY